MTKTIIACVIGFIIVFGLGYGLAHAFPSPDMAFKMVQIQNTQQYKDFVAKQNEQAQAFLKGLQEKTLTKETLNACGLAIQSAGYVITQRQDQPVSSVPAN
jgi:hypothetical protein